LGKGWTLLVDFGPKYSLLRILNPEEVLMEEQEFTEGFWRRERKKTQLKNFIMETFEKYKKDYDVPKFGEKEFDDVRMQISQAWDELGIGEEEKELPFAEELEENETLDRVAEEVLRSPQLLRIALDAIQKEQGVVGETANSLLTFFSMLSTIASEPINERVSGRGSTGKSTLVVAVSRLFPRDKMVMLSVATKKALYYDENLVESIDSTNRLLDAGSLILVVLEEENSMDFLNELKPLLAHDDVITRMDFAVGKGGGEPETHHLWIRGWPSYVGVTTKPSLEETQTSRTLLITPERGGEKYSAVTRRKAFESSYPWFRSGEWRTDLLKRAINKLEEFKVWNPFSDIVEEEFPSHKASRMMRDWERLEGLMETITLFFQKQRRSVRINGKEHLVTSPVDVEIALEVAKNAMAEAIQGLDPDVREFYLHLKGSGQDEFHGYADLGKEYEEAFQETVNRTDLRERYVKKLQERNLIQVDDSTKPYVFSINPRQLEKLEDLRKEVGDLTNDEIKRKIKRKTLEFLKGLERIEEPSAEQALQKEYGIEIANPGIEGTVSSPPSEEYLEEIEEAIEETFLSGLSDRSKVMRPLKESDSWLKGGGWPDSDSSDISNLYGEKEEAEPLFEKPEEEEPEPLYEKPGKEEEEESERLCEECKKLGIDDKPAVDKFPMGGKEKWLCEDCARDAGFLEGYT